MNNDENLKYNNFTFNLQKAKQAILKKSESFTTKELELLQKVHKLKESEGSIFDLSTIDILDKIPKILSKEKKNNTINKKFIMSDSKRKNQNDIQNKESLKYKNEDNVIIEDEKNQKPISFVNNEQNNSFNSEIQENKMQNEDENKNLKNTNDINIFKCLQNNKDYTGLQVNDSKTINSCIPLINKDELLQERNLLFEEIAKLRWDEINIQEKCLKEKLSLKKLMDEQKCLKINKEELEKENEHLSTILEELKKTYFNSQISLEKIYIDIANVKLLAEHEKIENQEQIEQLKNVKTEKEIKLKNLISKNFEAVNDLALYIERNANSCLHNDLINVKSQIDLYQQRILKFSNEIKALESNLKELKMKNQLEKEKLANYLMDLDSQLEKLQNEQKSFNLNFEVQKEQFEKTKKSINEKMSDLQFKQNERFKGCDEKIKEISKFKNDIEKIKIENEKNQENFMAILTDLSAKNQKKYNLLNENKKRPCEIKAETSSIIEALKGEIRKYENIITETKEKISEINLLIKSENDKKNSLQLKIDREIKEKQEHEQNTKNLKNKIENVKIMIDGANEITNVLESKKYNANLEISKNCMLLEKFRNFENFIETLKNEISLEKEKKIKMDLEKKKISQEKNNVLKIINQEKKKQKGGFSFFDLF